MVAAPVMGVVEMVVAGRAAGGRVGVVQGRCLVDTGAEMATEATAAVMVATTEAVDEAVEERAEDFSVADAVGTEGVVAAQMVEGGIEVAWRAVSMGVKMGANEVARVAEDWGMEREVVAMWVAVTVVAVVPKAADLKVAMAGGEVVAGSEPLQEGTELVRVEAGKEESTAAVIVVVTLAAVEASVGAKAMAFPAAVARGRAAATAAGGVDVED